MSRYFRFANFVLFRSKLTNKNMCTWWKNTPPPPSLYSFYTCNSSHLFLKSNFYSINCVIRKQNWNQMIFFSRIISNNNPIFIFISIVKKKYIALFSKNIFSSSSRSMFKVIYKSDVCVGRNLERPGWWTRGLSSATHRYQKIA